MLGTPRLYWKRGQPTVATLLFHRFVDTEEAHSDGIDRLRRQLQWLHSNYTPISLSRFVSGLHDDSLPDNAVLVTTDDALTNIFEVADEFKSFEVPLSAFVCAGWTASASSGTGEDLTARAVAAIQWYDGNRIEAVFGNGRRLMLTETDKAQNIDTLIAESSLPQPELAELCERLEGPRSQWRRICCTWNELRELAGKGVGIGAHSVSHVRLSRTSPIRCRFEIAESKRLCEALLGRCEAFAYPYGTPESHSAQTRDELQRAGFTVAFLTHSDLVTASSDSMTLPRMAMPDEVMTLPEFQARARGAGIALRRVKELLFNRLQRT